MLLFVVLGGLFVVAKVVEWLHEMDDDIGAMEDDDDLD